MQTKVSAFYKTAPVCILVLLQIIQIMTIQMFLPNFLFILFYKVISIFLTESNQMVSDVDAVEQKLADPTFQKTSGMF